MSDKKQPILHFVIPCYNEEEILNQFIKKENTELFDLYNKLIIDKVVSKDSRIIIVNDGSKDDSWNLLKKLKEAHPYITCLKLSRNRGHQNALIAGLMYSYEQKADITISMDIDLQDDVGVIPDMIKEYIDGSEIVYGVRNKRTTDTFFKRFTAEGYYKVLSILGVEIIFNHADYRLMSYKALDALNKYNEKNLFLRGIIPQLGFKTSKIFYERKERIAGESKYPLKKMLALAFEGITSFSVKPIRMILGSGIIICLLSFVMLLYSVIQYFNNNTVAGWSSLMASIWMLGGIQIVFIGVIGEYIGKTYLETKNRPSYLIEEIY